MSVPRAPRPSAALPFLAALPLSIVTISPLSCCCSAWIICYSWAGDCRLGIVRDKDSWPTHVERANLVPLERCLGQRKVGYLAMAGPETLHLFPSPPIPTPPRPDRLQILPPPGIVQINHSLFSADGAALIPTITLSQQHPLQVGVS